jgi:hypothetical protein
MMVDLTLYLRTYQFEHGLNMLEKGYTAARDALYAEIERTRTEATVYEESLSNGGKWMGDYEDGHLLWDQSQVYEAQINDVYSATFEVRKVFVIALYHFWEDSVAHWMKLDGKQATHEELSNYCAEKGYGPSPDLGAVQCLANHLKHGRNSRKNWLKRLNERHPSFLPETSSFIFGFSDDTLFKVAATIRASGPISSTPPA